MVAVCLDCKTEAKNWDDFSPCKYCGGKVQSFNSNEVTDELKTHIDRNILQDPDA